MRLASDIIAIPHGRNQAVRLRPSLRAAVRLHHTHDLRKLAEGIADGNLGMIADMILEGTDRATAATLINGIHQKGLRELDALVEPLCDFTFALLGVDRNQAVAATSERPEENADASDWITQHLERLFEIATGWFGWSPADTWAATPTEIMIAHRGFIARTKALNGIVDDPEYDSAKEVTPAEVKAGLAKLRELSEA